MGIYLAIKILQDLQPGSKDDAADELVRESFWMTNEELVTARDWAVNNSCLSLKCVMDHESATRKTSDPVSFRTN